jgi:asparagine synthase (glutamine-hydrolysing)
MCGIAGLLAGGRVEAGLVRRMIAPIAHRGPDDQGVWVDPEAGIGLGHRRLSIVDLSPLGHQPMESADGRWVLSYNGEIYNHLALRKALEETRGAVAWRGHSDTETLVECVAAWGLEATLEKSVGMFALALWDRKERALHLARDRFGEKPLYYGWVGGDFVFASELKAIHEHPRFDNRISRDALRLFAARTYVPAPLSIYERLYKLEPGCILTVSREAARRPLSAPPVEGRSEGGVSLHSYWSYREVMRRGFADPIKDEAEALELLERTLAQAIGGQSVADVPVGAFLSGGIDSSTIVALYQKYSSIPVRTFSIGFEEAGFNEAEYAKAVAKHLGTVHHERYVTVKEARDVIPLLPAMYDEPFADSSQIPTHLVSRFAREQVTVALSGDGGDELFAGYNRHFAAPQLWRKLQMLPRAMRAMIGPPLSQLPSGIWNIAGRQPHFGAKVQKALRVAGSARSFDDVYNSFLDEWSFERSPVMGAGEADTGFDLDVAPGAPDAVRMMYCDAISYLPDDILCKVDRASMAVSLETRVPFLDHRVAELAARIPVSMKVRGGKGKHILRELLYREAPRALFERPKAGFAIPVGEWLRGPLRPWAEELLEPGRMAQEGYFDAAIVRRRWQEHLSGRRDSTPALWAVLMFQAWHRQEPESRREAA